MAAGPFYRTLHPIPRVQSEARKRRLAKNSTTFAASGSLRIPPERLDCLS